VRYGGSAVVGSLCVAVLVRGGGWCGSGGLGWDRVGWC